MESLRKNLDFVLSQLTIGIFVVLLLCVVWQVLARWMGVESTYTDEAARFMFIWAGLFGAALGHGQKRHLAIDLLTNKLTGHKKAVSDAVIHILVILFAGSVMIYGGTKVIFNTQGQLSAVMQIPIWIIYLAIPINGAAIVFYSFYDLLQLLIKTNRSTHSSQEQGV